jgi:hypothetical protein
MRLGEHIDTRPHRGHVLTVIDLHGRNISPERCELG